MNIQSAINKELFVPRDEHLLVAVEVQRRKRKRVSFLPPGGKANYVTFMCLSVTNTRPHQLLLTKVKQFGGSSSFTRRSQWTVDQLQQVNGINPNKDSPDFDLVFNSKVDQWVARSSAEKCIFIQILYQACHTYWEGKACSLGKVSQQSAQHQGAAGTSLSTQGHGPRTLQAQRKSSVPPRQTEFINCQSKLTGDACTMNLFIYRCKVFLNRLKYRMVTRSRHSQGQGRSGPHPAGSAVGNVVHRINVAMGERGDRLTHAEDRTVELLHKAQQFADTAHKLALKHSK
ncbi:syntaxin binding protein 6 (amisyn), like [Thalassophryne amazonica]|uniref:syntaxin binding protein 6 (amisyn), like n=1 Tax=Thalassophryne amazonica TaxID=390379 RepID=UPI001470FF45|nr:syntaxin binding protein 6 (amisyn), like [Thalassophryne amazonica]